jgi:hypothetical protein
METCASELVHFDNGRPLAKLSSANRCRISAWSAAEYGYIYFNCHLLKTPSPDLLACSAYASIVQFFFKENMSLSQNRQ